jgi:hypothetical protein
MKKQLASSLLPIRGLLLGALVVLLAWPSDIFSQALAEDHLVSSQALQQQIVSSSSARQKNISTVRDFLSSPAADRAMRDAKIDPVQVRTAIPTLSDEELANLAARSTDAQQKFSAGLISSTMLLLLIVIIAVIIIVAAVH